MSRPKQSSCQVAERSPSLNAAAETGFTLIELMVVLVILSVLASLSLAGLNVGRQRAKKDKTASTIAKLNDIILEQYEGYSTRLKGTSRAQLGALRATMVEEMPDAWANVLSSPSTASGRAYKNYKQAGATSSYQGAECLFMIITRSGYAPDAIESFRPDEVGDADQDKMKEFLDGWGHPIAFLRWAPGFSAFPDGTASYSPVQIADSVNNHDPLDLGQPTPNDSSAFAMVPLIYSPGPDEDGSSSSSGYGLLTTGTAGWPTLPADLEQGICVRQDSSGKGLIGAPDPDNPKAFRDNITNHDIMAR